MAEEKKQKLRTVYEYSARLLSGEVVEMSDYKGKVLLVVNVAGLSDVATVNFTQLNEVAEKFKDVLRVLAFPCNQFGNQVIFFIFHHGSL